MPSHFLRGHNNKFSLFCTKVSPIIYFIIQEATYHMSDRPVNCFKCGGDGHFARNCPQSTCLHSEVKVTLKMQNFASIAKSQGISLVSVLREKREKNMVAIDQKVEIGNASIADPLGIFLEIAKVKLDQV